MPPAQAGVAAAVASTSRQVGQTLGVAVIGAVAGGGVAVAIGPGFAEATHAGWWIIVVPQRGDPVIGALGVRWAHATAERVADAPGAVRPSKLFPRRHRTEPSTRPRRPTFTWRCGRASAIARRPAGSGSTPWPAGCRTSPTRTSRMPASRPSRSGSCGGPGSSCTAGRALPSARCDHVLQRARPDVGRARGRRSQSPARSAVEATALWVHLDPDSRTPAPFSPEEQAMYGPRRARGRRISARLRHPAPRRGRPSPAGASGVSTATSPSTSTTRPTGSRWRRSC